MRKLMPFVRAGKRILERNKWSLRWYLVLSLYTNHNLQWVGPLQPSGDLFPLGPGPNPQGRP